MALKHRTKLGFLCKETQTHYVYYSQIQGTHQDHENLFLITRVSYKCIVNKFLDKDWEMKVSSLYPEIPYKRVPYKRTLL